ncbi:MAG TPA: hypothetical protein VD838_20485 [Anaeromyxobacteraceae bacterium]|nr:hypothetical protein [Anaeromyxobacteraceae bacterium]
MNLITTASVPSPQGGPPTIREDVPDRGYDLDPARRPGVPKLHAPEPLPNAKYPPDRQAGRPSVWKHNRPHKPFPAVFGTAVPPAGLSGLVRKAAYAYPDHMMRHWTLLLLSDRVDLWEHRTRKLLPLAAPALAIVVAGFAALARRR